MLGRSPRRGSRTLPRWGLFLPIIAIWLILVIWLLTPRSAQPSSSAHFPELFNSEMLQTLPTLAPTRPQNDIEVPPTSSTSTMLTPHASSRQAACNICVPHHSRSQLTWEERLRFPLSTSTRHSNYYGGEKVGDWKCTRERRAVPSA